MKKAFTLAEILIVLTIIGVMAVMTIPSLMQNANSQHKIAMFKKAFNAVSNAYATEFAVMTPPTKNTDRPKVFRALENQLNVKYYYNVEDKKKEFSKPPENLYSRFQIITEDNIGYHPTYLASNTCNSKLNVNKEKTTDKAAKSTCIIVYINIDGQESDDVKECSDDVELENLNCSKLAVFVTKDGITAGNPDCTISGRIMSDNTTYDENKCKEENP